MSALIELQNSIRQSSTVGWLTAQQREAYEFLLARSQVCSPAVLAGPPGSGKSQIGWLLCREVGLGHTSNPMDIPDLRGAQTGLVIDNADLVDVNARDLFGGAVLHDWTSAVILARFIEPKGLPVVHLAAPSEADIVRCLAQMPISLKFVATGIGTNLWKAILAALLDEELERVLEE